MSLIPPTTLPFIVNPPLSIGDRRIYLGTAQETTPILVQILQTLPRAMSEKKFSYDDRMALLGAVNAYKLFNKARKLVDKVFSIYLSIHSLIETNRSRERALHRYSTFNNPWIPPHGFGSYPGSIDYPR